MCIKKVYARVEVLSVEGFMPYDSVYRIELCYDEYRVI